MPATQPAHPSNRNGAEPQPAVFWKRPLVLVTAGVTVFIAYLLNYAASNILHAIFTPHNHLFHSSTIEYVADRASVVQPLINRQQTFNLFATVWLRTSKDVPHIGGSYPKDAGSTHGTVEEKRIRVEEELLFGEMIFQGLRLSDKNLHTTVNFSVPTDIFRQAHLTNYDLRASVILVPHVPSLLDFATNYTSHIPENMDTLPVQPWPSSEEKTMHTQALESFAVTIPLIQFHGVRSQCKAPKRSPQTDVPYANPHSSLITTNGGENPHQHYPYIVTRTDIRALKEDRLFDLEPYLRAFAQSKISACAQNVFSEPNQFSCKGPFRRNGNWETLFQLRVPDKSTGERKREWAYAPYFYLSRYGFGIKDLLEIPVHSSRCGDGEDLNRAEQEPDKIDVNWKVSYSGLTSAEMTLMDNFEVSKHYSFVPDATDDSLTFEHDNAEMAFGAAGQRFSKNAHPRRRWIMFILSSALVVITKCLDGWYWFYGPSTVSISIIGTTFLAGAAIINELDLLVVKGIAYQFSLNDWAISLIKLPVITLVLPLSLLKRAYRIDLVPLYEVIPTFHLRQATPLERSHQQLEVQKWKQIVVSFLCTTGLYYFFPLQKIPIIPAMTPQPDSGSKLHGTFPPYVLYALDLSGRLLQINFNWQTRSFGGKSRLSALLTLVLRCLELSKFVPAIMGHIATRGALYAEGVVDVVMTLVLAYQAITLASPPDVMDKERVE